jgi:hypothetical protein
MPTIEGFSFEKEGFYTFTTEPSTKQDILNNQEIMKLSSDQLMTNDAAINTYHSDISGSIYGYKMLRQSMGMDVSNSTPYNKIYIPDRSDMIQTTLDVRKDDINTLLLQQNYIYIVGSVTCATLLIAAIMISKNQP